MAQNCVQTDPNYSSEKESLQKKNLRHWLCEKCKISTWIMLDNYSYLCKMDWWPSELYTVLNCVVLKKITCNQGSTYSHLPSFCRHYHFTWASIFCHLCLAVQFEKCNFFRQSRNKMLSLPPSFLTAWWGADGLWTCLLFLPNAWTL